MTVHDLRKFSCLNSVAPKTRLSGKMVNRFRREVLSLPPQTRARYLAAKRQLFTLQAYSRHIAPRAEDWPSTLHTTGFCFLKENRWELPDDLIEFLDSGEPPVCIGFGSMVSRNHEQLTQIVVNAMRECRVRAVLLSGWAGIGDAEFGDNIYRIEAAPHE